MAASVLRWRTNLLVLHLLQDFDDTLRIVGNIHALKHLTVLAPAHLSYDFIVVL